MKLHPILVDLREIRLAHNLTQEVLCGMAGYNRSQIGKYERGGGSPRLDTISDWAAALGYELVLRRSKK